MIDGNLAMNSHFENMSEKDSNDMADFYIWAKGDLWVRYPGKEDYWADLTIPGRVLSTAELYSIFKTNNNADKE